MTLKQIIEKNLHEILAKCDDENYSRKDIINDIKMSLMIIKGCTDV